MTSRYFPASMSCLRKRTSFSPAWPMTSSLSPAGHRAVGPVESCPDGAGGVVAVDAPVGSEGADDIEPMMPCGVTSSLGSMGPPSSSTSIRA